mgnify:CR=1 FL=1
MTKRERIRAAIAHEDIDRVPASFWGHFASDPHTAAPLAEETLRFQRRFDWDFVKIMPSGMYYPEALGCTLSPASGPGAVNGLVDSIVKAGTDWHRIPVLTPDNRWLAEHVQTVRLVRDALGPDIPVIQTLFSPLTVAHKMCVHVSFEESVSDFRAELLEGLSSITTGTIEFAHACVDAGADGFFFATQEASRGSLSAEDFDALGRQFDLEILRSIRDRCSFQLLHVCRSDIRADMVADYPVDAINWEDQAPNPTMPEARRIWKQALCGGLDRNGSLLHGTPEQVAADVAAVVASAGRLGLIISAGCALPVARPDANLDAVRAALA